MLLPKSNGFWARHQNGINKEANIIIVSGMRFICENPYFSECLFYNVWCEKKAPTTDAFCCRIKKYVSLVAHAVCVVQDAVAVIATPTVTFAAFFRNIHDVVILPTIAITKETYIGI